MTQLNKTHLEDKAQILLSALDPRSKDIIARRYGIESGHVETLDSIGREYGITRERVRQIEAQAKKILAKRNDILSDVDKTLQDIFRKHGGVLGEAHLMEVVDQELVRSPKATVVTFYLDILHPYEYVTRSAVFGSHWRHEGLHNEYAERVIAAAEIILKRTGHPMPEAALIAKIRSEAGVSEETLANNCIYALLRASRNLNKTVFGEWGMADWVETSPRGVGDKAYIVLRRHGKPAHFRDITHMINEIRFDHKRAHEQTVHNELIKDDRFVLVGRGLYALTEWGYIPGTVADVLETILREANQPLTREELLARVLKQRLVKKTTVLLGLQNSERFSKVEDNLYSLKK